MCGYENCTLENKFLSAEYYSYVQNMIIYCASQITVFHDKSKTLLNLIHEFQKNLNNNSK